MGGDERERRSPPQVFSEVLAQTLAMAERQQSAMSTSEELLVAQPLVGHAVGEGASEQDAQMGLVEEDAPREDYSSGGAAAPGAAVPTSAVAPSTGNDRPSTKFVSFVEEPGLQAICVRYAPAYSWCQKTVYVSPECNSDHLKWHLSNSVGLTVSTTRVHEGFKGLPYDRFTPLLEGAPGADPADKQKGPLMIIPSFGP